MNPKNITKEFLEREYLENKKPITKISEELNIPHETLYYYKNKFGIPTYSNTFWFKGKRHSPQTEFKKGMIPWNKGTKGLTKAWNKGKKLTEDQKKKISENTKRAMSNPLLKQRISDRLKIVMNHPEVQIKIQKTQFKKGHSPWNKGIKTNLRPRLGIKHTQEARKKMERTYFKKGIIPWNKNKTNVYRPETISKIREARLKQKIPNKNTKIEIILFNILDELNIQFMRHAPINNICQSDAFIPPNIALFADGDYWHANPKRNKPLNAIQINHVNRDRRANQKLKEAGYLVQRFWESDLLNNRDKCKQIIQSLVKTNI